MSNERVEISLIGAASYGTLTTVFQKGTPHAVTLAVWEYLKNETNPSTGETLFCLTSELPEPVSKDSPDITSADLRASGLGELDTGSQAVQNNLSDMDLEDAPQVPLIDADGEELPSGASDDAPVGETTLTSALGEDASKVDSDPSTASTDTVSAPRKVTIGKAAKAVQV